MKKLEIIAQNIDDIKLLNEIDGPIEIELCSGMEADGLTPNYKVIKECVNNSKHPIRIMIRNHNKGFYYNPQEVKLMLDQIMQIIDFCEPTGFVYGCLTEGQNAIDYDTLELLSSASIGFSNTFHKAIEPVLEIDNINSLKDFHIERVLTQGGKCEILQNVDKIKEILNSECEIILGGGINLDNISEVLSLTSHIHMGSALRINNSYKESLDVDKIKQVLSLLK